MVSGHHGHFISSEVPEFIHTAHRFAKKDVTVSAFKGSVQPNYEMFFTYTECLCSLMVTVHVHITAILLVFCLPFHCPI